MVLKKCIENKADIGSMAYEKTARKWCKRYKIDIVE